MQESFHQPEAGNIESRMAGLRDIIQNDYRLLEVAGGIFDGLLATFAKLIA